MAIAAGTAAAVLIVAIATTALSQGPVPGEPQGGSDYPYTVEHPPSSEEPVSGGAAASGAPSKSSSAPPSEKAEDGDTEKDTPGADTDDNAGDDSSGGGGNDDTDDGADYPSEGTYDVSVRHTGFCLGIGQEPGNPGRDNVLVQDGCSSASPSLQLDSLGDGDYRITMYFSDSGWSACLGADTAYVGDLLGAYACGGSRQTFRLVPVGNRFQIKVSATGHCIDFPYSSSTEGAQAATAACNSGRSSQQFSFT